MRLLWKRTKAISKSSNTRARADGPAASSQRALGAHRSPRFYETLKGFLFLQQEKSVVHVMIFEFHFLHAHVHLYRAVYYGMQRLSQPAAVSQQWPARRPGWLSQSNSRCRGLCLMLPILQYIVMRSGRCGLTGSSLPATSATGA